MIIKRFVSVGLFVSIAACGGSSSKAPDAKTFEDASGSAFGLGTSCTNGSSADQSLCMSPDPICTTVSQDGSGNAIPPFWCTAVCGFSACAAGGTAGSADCLDTGSSTPTPPAGGDAICQGLAEGAGGTGTGACILSGPGPGSGSSAVQWGCGILCGQNGSANQGDCPSDLTCTDGICQ